MSRNITPSLRFPEFKEPWAEEHLDFFFSSSRAKGRDGLPTLSVTLDRGLIDRAELDRKMETNLGPDEHLLVREKDIAYNMMRMWQGAFGRSDREGIVSPAYVVIRPKGTADSAYFAYAFRRNRSIYLFWAYSYGITNDRLRLYADDFLRIPFRAPKVPEQQKIAAFLTAVDGRIEQLSRKRALLEEYKKGVMQQLFTQTLRFQDDHGHDFPDWEEKKLSEIASIFDGTHSTPEYTKTGIPFYSVEHVTNGQYTKTKFISEEVFEKENKRVRLERGDILMTRIGDIGTSVHINWDVKASFYVSLALIKPRKALAVSEYVHQAIGSRDFQRELWQRTIHSAFPIKINLGEIGECKIRLPSLPEQTKIAGFLSALDGKIGAVGEQMRQTQAWKKGLLQQMFV